MQKIRVMHVLNTGSYSGAENVAITIIKETKDFAESTYVSLVGQIAERLEADNIRHVGVRKLTIANIRGLEKTLRPNIVHAHDFTAGIMCAAARMRVPIINHLHQNPPWIKKRGLRSCAYALSSGSYKRILTVSDAVVKEYVFGKRIESKTTVVGNPIDLKRIRSMVEEDAIKYDIAFLGRLSPSKDPLAFLEIVKEVVKRRHDTNAIMIGDGEMKDCIEQKIHEYGLSQHVILVGFQENPYPYLNRSRLLLMPSSWEGYGLAAAEALALGKPVICSNAGGLPSIVDNSCGKVCLNRNDYLDALMDLLEDDNKYNDYSRNALAKAQSLSNVDDYSKLIMSIYHDVIGAK